MCLLAPAALALAGCGSVNLGRSSLETVRLAVSGRQVEAVPDPAQVAASPYAQILVRGSEGSALLLLGNVDDGREAYYSGDRAIVYLRAGLLEATSGLAQDVDQVRIEGENPFAHLAGVRQPVETARRYDWRVDGRTPGYRYGVPVRGRLERIGPERVQILGAARDLVHFRETLHGPGVSGGNDYWADPATGFIWKSRQLVAPDLFLEITQLKPYQAPGRAVAAP